MRRLISIVLCLAGLSGPACSYSTKRLTDFPEARTIAVVPFSNSGFYRDLELQLTRAVVGELRARTSFALVSPQSADLLIRGSMTAREWAIGLDERGEVIQRRLEGWLSFEVVRRVGGKVLRKATVSANEEFRPGVQGESLETSGTQEWSRRIAEQVVQMLERGF